MITAWVLYRNIESDVYSFEERNGMDYLSTDPAAWGLNNARHEILLVMQKASFIQAWVKGKEARRP